MRYLQTFFLLIALMAPVWAAPVTDEAAAEKLLARARAILSGVGLTVPRQILLKLRTRDELMVENNSSGGRAIEANGFYRAYNPESIWIVSGLSEEETIGVLAHELTHAWQSTEAPLQDRKLTEGFARWAEYKVFMAIGASGEAQTLRRSPDPDYGGGLRYLLDLEQRRGAAAVVEFARTQTRIPD
ncbi:MAG: hypothetical protein FJX76_26310 [Armatimonadetes bacterium]|nr:hypothetical protein [Armatimonadota bacterium]